MIKEKIKQIKKGVSAVKDVGVGMGKMGVGVGLTAIQRAIGKGKSGERLGLKGLEQNQRGGKVIREAIKKRLKK